MRLENHVVSVDYREEEKSCGLIDQKYTSKADSASSNSSSYIINRTSPSRTMIPVNQLVAQDSNANSFHPLIAISKTTLERGNSSTVTSIKVSSMGFAHQEEGDIESEAAAQLLTKQEKTLCLQLDMKPTQYLTQKTLLLQEYLNGNRRSGVAPQSEPESKILHYLVSNGWIAAN